MHMAKLLGTVYNSGLELNHRLFKDTFHFNTMDGRGYPGFTHETLTKYQGGISSEEAGKHMYLYVTGTKYCPLNV